MKIAAITITFNRLDLTKRTLESFNNKTKVDYHLIIDNGSTDGTQEWIKQFDHIQLDRNYGIANAFICAYNALPGYDYYLKLDNDVEPVTDDIITKMLKFYELNGEKFVCSPPDLTIDPNYYPPILKKAVLNGYNVEYVSHTGGAFQLIPAKICKQLCENRKIFAYGDSMIGRFYRERGYPPVYLKDLGMNHIGLNQSTPRNLYVM